MDRYDKGQHATGWYCDGCRFLMWVSIDAFPDVFKPSHGLWSGMDHKDVLEKIAGWTVDRKNHRYYCAECTAEGKCVWSQTP